MPLEITSLKNPRLKNLIDLQKPRDRREQGLFVIEGIREVSLAQQSGYALQTVYLSPEVYSSDPHYPISLQGLDVLHLPADLFSKVAYRETVGGIIATAKMKLNQLTDLPQVQNPLYLILEQVEKPGNIGAMLRTADAAGLSGVIVCDPATDFYNPNVIRSSVGCLFSVPTALGANEEVYTWLKSRGVTTYAAALSEHSKPYHAQDYQKPTAFLLGSEADGLSSFWIEKADEKVIIPMRGKIDSMNVSNAAAVLIFEAVRQRG